MTTASLSDSYTHHVTVIEGVRFVLGLEWRLIPPTRALQRTLSLARKENKAKYVLTDMEDIIGLCGPLANKWGNVYSAALHLAGRLAQGGLELYVFAVPKGKYMVVALNESRPIPGFDFLGSEEEARALIDEFLAIQQGQPMRFVGNTGWLEGEESVAIEDIFVSPARGTRMKHLPARHIFKWLLGVGTVVGVGVAGTNYWLETEREEMLAASREVPPDPNLEYQNTLKKALADLPAPGPSLLREWEEVIKDIPLMHAGWKLQQIECEVKQCTAHWVRLYGTYADFFQTLPANSSSAKEVQSGEDALQAMVVSYHPVKMPEKQHPMQSNQLPRIDQALRDMASQLQDFSLLGKVRVELSKPKIFGGQQDPNVVNGAVLSGEWKVQHEASTLSYLVVPTFGIPQKLSLYVGGNKDQSPMSYEFIGQYYVQAIPK